MTHYFWDENSVRYQFVQSNNSPSLSYNWLFFPGGPGADSACLFELANGLMLPGNTWLVDLPNNGSNKISDNYNFDSWFELFLPTISRFKNAICVGHSFGGMFPLVFPQLEQLLVGFVILNSIPSPWHEEAERVARAKEKPSSTESLQAFIENPNPTTFKCALMACAPYYFPDQSLAKGKLLLEKLEFNYYAAGWWLQKIAESGFKTTWVPEKLPTLIIGGTEDCITPATLFQNDKRFHRSNIKQFIIENAGHMPWIEDMNAVKTAFDEFMQLIE